MNTKYGTVIIVDLFVFKSDKFNHSCIMYIITNMMYTGFSSSHHSSGHMSHWLTRSSANRCPICQHWQPPYNGALIQYPASHFLLGRIVYDLCHKHRLACLTYAAQPRGLWQCCVNETQIHLCEIVSRNVSTILNDVIRSATINQKPWQPKKPGRNCVSLPSQHCTCWWASTVKSEDTL